LNLQQLRSLREADIGIATEALAQHASLATLPCYRWTHLVLVPPGHPLERPGGAELTLRELAAYPLISYEPGFTGRSHIDAAFVAAGLRPEFALVAMDADVIKTYVRLGLGVGIIAAVAFDPQRDAPLQALEARHLFEPNLTRLAVRRDALLRDVDYAFIAAFAPPDPAGQPHAGARAGSCCSRCSATACACTRSSGIAIASQCWALSIGPM